MSYTTKIKNEIITLREEASEKIAFLSGFIRNNGLVDDKTLYLTTENPLIKDKLVEELESIYEIDVEVEINGEKQKCMAYVMNGREISLPTAGYYNTIVKGYRENGFDEKYLVDALKQAFDYEQKIKQEECEEIAEESEELEEGLQMTME